MKKERVLRKNKRNRVCFWKKKKNFYKGDLISNIFLWTYTLNTPKRMSYRGQKKKKEEVKIRRRETLIFEMSVWYIL